MVVADFLRALSVQPFYVSFIDLVLFLPLSPQPHPIPCFPPPPFRDSPQVATPCQNVKAAVKRRASAINHSRSRYYARIRVLVGRLAGESATMCLHDLFICDRALESAISNKDPVARSLKLQPYRFSLNRISAPGNSYVPFFRIPDNLHCRHATIYTHT